MKRLVVRYAGRVQGVGFRATVRQLACGFDVTGSVQNLDDGRVEIIAEGARAELEAFVQAIDESGLSGFIGKKEEAWKPAQRNLRGFTIRL